MNASVRRLWGLLFIVAACSGVDADEGLDAELNVDGAQFVRGAVPQVSADGPRVRGITLVTPTFEPGERGKSLTAALDARATAAIVLLQQDSGYFVVPAGAPLIDTPDLASLVTSLSFAPTMAPSEHVLEVHAVDANGNVGPGETTPIRPRATPAPSNAPLRFTLTWDRDADLDLQVDLPSGARIEHGTAADVAGTRVQLGPDSNAACVVDGHRVESVDFPEGLPSGLYRARVETRSMCSETSARWTVTATEHGRVVAMTRGETSAIDTRFVGSGGELALEVVVP